MRVIPGDNLIRHGIERGVHTARTLIGETDQLAHPLKEQFGRAVISASG